MNCAPHLVGEIADQSRIVGALGPETLVVAERLAVNDPIRDRVGENAERAEPRKCRRNRRDGDAEFAEPADLVECGAADECRKGIAIQPGQREDPAARKQRRVDLE